MKTPILLSLWMLAAIAVVGCLEEVSLDDDFESTTQCAPATETAPCELNTGWPCTCDRPGELCDDGSLCSPWYSICVASCELDPPGTCPATGYESEGVCQHVWGESGNESFCFLECEEDCDCPQDQFCVEDGEWSMSRCDPCETFPDC